MEKDHRINTEMELKAEFWNVFRELRAYPAGQSQAEYDKALNQKFIEFVAYSVNYGSANPKLSNLKTL